MSALTFQFLLVLAKVSISTDFLPGIDLFVGELK